MSEKSGYSHKEAFCLMWYQCKACGGRVRIWNSRDGVTPFGIRCRAGGCTSADGKRLVYSEPVGG